MTQAGPRTQEDTMIHDDTAHALLASSDIPAHLTEHHTWDAETITAIMAPLARFVQTELEARGIPADEDGDTDLDALHLWHELHHERDERANCAHQDARQISEHDGECRDCGLVSAW